MNSTCARRLALLFAVLAPSLARAQLVLQPGSFRLGIPGLHFELKTEFGGGSLCRSPESLRPLSGPPSPFSNSTSPERISVLMGLEGALLFLLPNAGVGIRGSAETALWDGYVFSLGAEGGFVWRTGGVTWMLFGELGADALVGVGGGLLTNGTPGTTWLPQAGASARVSFWAWGGARLVAGLWGRSTLWRHDEQFFQITDPFFGSDGSKQFVNVAVGGYLFGVSFGLSSES